MRLAHLIPTLVAALIAISLAQADGALAQGEVSKPKTDETVERKAVLVETGDAVCHWPTGEYAWIWTTRFEVSLPEVNGPVAVDGTFSITFTKGDPGIIGTRTGTARLSGTVKDDEELEFIAIWTDPISGPGEITKIALEPGSRIDKAWSVTDPNAGGPCEFAFTWRIDFKRAERVYDITWKGTRRLENNNTYPAFDPSLGEWITIDHRFGFTFSYDLLARVTLEQRKGVWAFKSAVVQRAEAKADYDQSPELYRIISSRCDNCDRVRSLAGRSLHGEARPGRVRINWPSALQTMATVNAVFAYQCAAGPEQATCEHARRHTSDYSDQDGEFFERVNRLWIPLEDLPPVHSEFWTSQLHTKSLKIDFRVRPID